MGGSGRLCRLVGGRSIVGVELGGCKLFPLFGDARDMRNRRERPLSRMIAFYHDLAEQAVLVWRRSKVNINDVSVPPLQVQRCADWAHGAVWWVLTEILSSDVTTPTPRLRISSQAIATNMSWLPPACLPTSSIVDYLIFTCKVCLFSLCDSSPWRNKDWA